MNNINELVKNCVCEDDEVLDIGCGNKQRSSDLLCKKVVTLDAWYKVNPDILLDLEASDLPFPPKSFDVILMIDFIEHLERDRGHTILEQAKQIARKSIILLTPLWWTTNKRNVNNPKLWSYHNNYDYHKSLWAVEDFVGWDRVSGIKGLQRYFVGIYNCRGVNNVQK
jgi:SAM-dependent methyltransferase